MISDKRTCGLAWEPLGRLVLWHSHNVVLAYCKHKACCVLHTLQTQLSRCSQLVWPSLTALRHPMVQNHANLCIDHALVDCRASFRSMKSIESGSTFMVGSQQSR